MDTHRQDPVYVLPLTLQRTPGPRKVTDTRMKQVLVPLHRLTEVRGHFVTLMQLVMETPVAPIVPPPYMIVHRHLCVENLLGVKMATLVDTTEKSGPLGTVMMIEDPITAMKTL